MLRINLGDNTSILLFSLLFWTVSLISFDLVLFDQSIPHKRTCFHLYFFSKAWSFHPGKQLIHSGISISVFQLSSNLLHFLSEIVRSILYDGE